MRLRKIELHGFKTFATRATLEFAPGITAIVGPNGSGKSNVADGIRWVLGEQSLKLLRGRKSEDVIFGGGAGRAPLGMADVSLTLDNSDGALPPEYAEVAVGRRSYRSGENEYYINRSRVRLRDVGDLLSRAGIGQNGHSVIGQGLVDLALSLRPEERRSLFEDAAGMRRYHAKKSEAESKLSEVASNATRVADLIAELEPRVAQLQRQARRAQDESRLRDQWRGAATALFAHQRWEIEAGLAVLAPQAERLAGTLAAATAAAGAAAAAVAAAAAQLEADRATLAGADRVREQARERVSVARREAAVARERHDAAARAARDLAMALERLEQRAAAAREALPGAQRARDAAAGALDAAWRAEHESAAAASAGPADGNADELRQARTALLERARELTQATTQLREAERQLLELDRQARESAAGRARADEALATHLAGAQRVEAALHVNAEALGTIQAQTAAAQAARGAAEAGVRAATEELSLNERENQALRVRLGVLRDVVRGPLPDSILPAGSARLAERLHVPPEMEAAVAAAAGDALDWVLVDSADEARRLALQHAAAGGRRMTFIARDALAAAGRATLPALPDHDGGLGYLADAMTRPTDDDHPDGARCARVLSESYLVQDLAAALRLEGQLNGGPRPLIVTLAGERVNQLGAVTAGAPPDEAAMLQRMRELREVETALTELAKAHPPLVAALATAREAQRRAVDEERRLDSRARALREEQSRLRGEQRALAQQQQRLEKDARWWSEFAERASKQHAELRDRLGWLEAQRRQAETAHQTAEERAGTLAAAVEAR